MSNWRYIATRLNGNATETVLDWDLPISGAVIRDDLSGPGSIRGIIEPETARLRVGGRPLLEPWSTAIYAEADGVIRGGGILVELAEEGPALTVDCVGFSGYAQGMPYVDEWSKTNIDPMDAVREIWRHLQSKPGGNLGLTLDPTKSLAKIGNVKKSSSSTSVSTNGKTGKTTTTTKDTSTIEPYVLAWYKTHNLGEEFVRLARETPFDYRVSHRWEGEKILHHMQLGYPEIKNRKTGLRFVVGENLFEVPELSYDGEQYADEVVTLGTGEGRKMIRGNAKRESPRLRRVAVVEDSSLTTAARANTFAQGELNARAGGVDISLVLQVEHPHAPIGSVSVGDDILIQTAAGWTDALDMWCRVLAVVLEPDRGFARLTVTRTEKARI